MTFDEALAHPGPLLATWDLTVHRGQRTLTIFSLAGDRATALAHEGFAVGEEDAAVATLRARGIPIGACDGFCDFAWVDDADGITVWNAHGRVLDARDVLTLADGRTIAHGELERVFAYASDDYVERGVRARLHSAEEAGLVRDVSATAAADPTYSRNELLYETEWAGAIAAAVAAWAGVPYENLI